MKDLFCLILAGGEGKRLYPLTKYRSKPAVPLAGKYRLIDVPISNCLHAGLYKMFVITQYSSESLNRHISTTYRFDNFSGGYVYILAAEQTYSDKSWYLGTADAVRHNIMHFESTKGDDVLILSGDQLYRMDIRDFLKSHRKTKADITLAVKPVPAQMSSKFGIVKTDEKARILDFKEKPVLKDAKEKVVLASMGIYIFKKKVLLDLLTKNTHMKDFGQEIIPQAIKNYSVTGYRYKGYWRDIGTISSFYDANLSLTNPNPAFNFYDAGSPIYTHPRFLPASRLEDVNVKTSMICEGCTVTKANITHSIIGIRSVISKNVDIQDAILMGSDSYENNAKILENKSTGIPNIGIGQNTRIRKAIIDKNARIGKDVIIENAEKKDYFQGHNYSIVDGIVVVEKNAIIPDGTII